MQLYVGGISDNTTEFEIKEVLTRVCPPQLVTIIRDIERRKGREGHQEIDSNLRQAVYETAALPLSYAGISNTTAHPTPPPLSSS
jgi:hypothetical protein